MASLQNSYATCALTSAMLARKNAKGTMSTTAKDVHRHAAAAPMNAEGWLDRNQATLFFIVRWL